MKTYTDYISAYRQIFEQGKSLTHSVEINDPAVVPGNGPVVLLFSPHPDDECISGGLALRLQREAGARVVNIPVTFGSNTERRAARCEELKASCKQLSFELPETFDLEGFDCSEKIAEMLRVYRPKMIFFPHAEDWNGTHERVHRLVMEALPQADVPCLLVQTEVWRSMKHPNLMIELPEDVMTAQIESMSLHVGEVARNPYHLSFPIRVMDNVRRGCEVVLGQGGESPDCMFAILYHLSKWVDGAQHEVLAQGRYFSVQDGVDELLKETF